MHQHSTWTQRSAFGLDAHSGPVALTLSCQDAVTRLDTMFCVDCSGGSLEVRLLDPDGHVRSRQTVRGGVTDTTLALPASPGEWRCELVFEEFSGDYTIELHAHDESAIRIDLWIESVEVLPRDPR